MNWTGGRLQRHSYKSYNYLKASQKRYFANARLKAQKRPRQRLYSSSATPRSQRLLTEISLPHQEQDSIDNYTESERQFDKRFSSGQSSKRCLKTKESQTFEQLRRELLKRKDWANLSIARPLRTGMFPRTDQRTANTAKRHPRQQIRKDRAPSQEKGLDVDISRGLMMDFPTAHLGQNCPDAHVYEFTHMNIDDIYIEVQKKRTPVGTSNSPSDRENLQIEEGFETDMETTRIANSPNFYRIGGSSRGNGVLNAPYHREGEDLEISAVVGANSQISSPSCQSRHSSRLARPMDIQQRSPGPDDLTDELPANYWSIAGSESSAPSQDPSESMLLDIEEMRIVVPIEKEMRENFPYRPSATPADGARDEKHHRRDGSSASISDTSRHLGNFKQSEANPSASSTVPPRNQNDTEVVHLQAHRYIGQGSSSAEDSQNSVHGQAPSSTNVPLLPPPPLKARYYMYPERFPNHSLRYVVSNLYVAHDTSSAPDVRSASKFDSFNGPPVSDVQGESSSAVNQSLSGESISDSLQQHGNVLPQNRHDSIKSNQSAQGETRDQEQRFHKQPTHPDLADAAQPETHVLTSRGNGSDNSPTDTDGEDYLWKNFVFRPATTNNSQDSNNYCRLPSPTHVEGSDLAAAADGPVYPDSLTEPNDASNESISHLWDTGASAVFDCANLNEAGRTGSSMCEIGSQNVVVGTTSDSSAHRNNVSESDNALNETHAPKDIANDTEDASSKAHSVETRDT